MFLKIPTKTELKSPFHPIGERGKFLVSSMKEKTDTEMQNHDQET